MWMILSGVEGNTQQLHKPHLHRAAQSGVLRVQYSRVDASELDEEIIGTIDKQRS
jgi:hypothetical protein